MSGSKARRGDWVTSRTGTLWRVIACLERSGRTTLWTLRSERGAVRNLVGVEIDAYTLVPEPKGSES